VLITVPVIYIIAVSWSRGKPVNPLTAKIPLAASVSHQQKKAFELDVVQYNRLMQQPLPPKESEIQVASNDPKDS
jgi:hypothetical protein